MTTTRDWEAEFEALEQAREAFQARAAARFSEQQIVVSRGADWDVISLTRSTRPDVDFQVTRWEFEEDQLVPRGHSDIRGDLAKAVKEMWDLSRKRPFELLHPDTLEPNHSRSAELGWPPERYDQEQLRRGIEVEFEHTDDRAKAQRIAMDHLAEQVLAGLPQDYYTRLGRMEQQMGLELNPKKLTYPQARARLIDYLQREGWKVRSDLKVPYATSPDGELRLWFKPQAVYFTRVEGPAARHTLKDARTISYDLDIRTLEPPEVVTLASERTGYQSNSFAWSQEDERRQLGYAEFGDYDENRQWTTAYINRLPDASFAYISPGGSKDESGRTVPRTLRHLPYKDKQGQVNLAHLRAALARLNQVEGLSQRREQQIRKKLEAVLSQHGGYERNSRDQLSNHNLDYGRAMAIANEELSRGGDAMAVVHALRQAGFDDDVFNQAIAIGADMQRRERLASIERGPTLQSSAGSLRRASEQDPFWRAKMSANREFSEEEAFAALHTRLQTPVKYASMSIEQGMHPDQAVRAASAKFGLSEHDTDILHYIMDAYEVVGTSAPPIRHRFEPTVPPMRAQAHHFAVNAYDPERQRLFEMARDEAEERLRAGESAQGVERAIKDKYGFDWDAAVRTVLMAEKLVNKERAQTHHFSVNRTALDIGSRVLYVPTEQVVSVVGYEAGSPVIVGQDEQIRVVSHNDLSHDAYELEVVKAMGQLLGGTDPAKVVESLMREDDLNEEFALVAMEDAAQRVATEAR